MKKKSASRDNLKKKKKTTKKKNIPNSQKTIKKNSVTKKKGNGTRNKTKISSKKRKQSSSKGQKNTQKKIGNISVKNQNATNNVVTKEEPKEINSLLQDVEEKLYVVPSEEKIAKVQEKEINIENTKEESIALKNVEEENVVLKDIQLEVTKEEIPIKRKKKKLVLRKEFVVLFLILFTTLSLYSSYNIIRWAIDAKNTKKQIEEIHKTVEIKEITDSVTTEIINPPKGEITKENPYWDYIKMNLINVDFTKLKEKNSDTVGWIQVSGTNINYPFVQTNNNTYYLKKDFNKKYNSAGWVFMDYRNNLENLNQNTIIYAHGRIDGTMFGSLKNITQSNWYNDKNNHIVKLSTEYQNTMWQVFSIYRIPETNDYLDINFNDNKEYNEFLKMLQDRSEYKFDVNLNEEDKILTLSTCYKENDRVVLHAKLIKMEVRNGNN